MASEFDWSTHARQWVAGLTWPLSQREREEISLAAAAEQDARYWQNRGDHYEAENCRLLAEQHRRAAGYGSG